MIDTMDDFPADRRAVMAWCAGAIIAGAGALTPLPSHAAAPPFSSPRISVVTRGTLGTNGRDILLIHGLASSPAIWSYLTRQLGGHRLHLVHINGFAGRSPGANATGPLLGPLTDELTRYIKTQGLRAPIIIGHSMGGILALMLGLRADVRPARIMVVDMLPDGSAMLGGTSQGYGYLARQLNGYLTGTKAGRQMLADMVRQTPGGEDSDPRVIAQALSELAQTDLTPDLKRLPCPLTVIPALPGSARLNAAQMQRYRAAYASVRMLTLTGIGPSAHQIMLDQPDRFTAAVRKFLD